jgi:hypothetical protein
MTLSSAQAGGPPSARMSIRPVARLLAVVSQACCRHTYLRKAGQARLWLECADCGHRTPGMHVATRSRERGRGGHVLAVCQDH